MVVNLASASVGLIDSISLVGPLRRPTLVGDILACCSAPSHEFAVLLELTAVLALGMHDGFVVFLGSAPLSNPVVAPAMDTPMLPF
jgi:hypothetical protein